MCTTMRARTSDKPRRYELVRESTFKFPGFRPFGGPTAKKRVVRADSINLFFENGWLSIEVSGVLGYSFLLLSNLLAFLVWR